MEPFYRDLGQRIRSAREAAGLSQGELGQRVGLSRASIANLERGAQRVALHKFIELATALGVEPAGLIPRNDDRVAKLRQALQEAGIPSSYAAWGERAMERVEATEREHGQEGA